MVPVGLENLSWHVETMLNDVAQAAPSFVAFPLWKAL
jgi:hypothetical protein